MNLEKAIEVLNTLKDVAKQNIDYIENCKLEDFLDIKYKQDKEEFEAIDTVLKELHTLQMNYKLLEEKFDGSAEEKVDKLTEELQTRYNKGYQDGYMAGAMEKI